MDLDKTTHLLLNDYASELGDLFGENLLDAQGGINRAALSSYVFADPVRLGMLEAFIHPRIEEVVDDTIRDNPGRLIVINGAALHKSRITHIIDGLIWMESPFWLRFIRAWKRDKRSLSNIWKRFRSQREFNPQQFPPHVDIYKVYNGLTLRRLMKRSEKMYSRWIMRGETK